MEGDLIRVFPGILLLGWILFLSARRLALGRASLSWPGVEGEVIDVTKAHAWSPLPHRYIQQWRGTTVRYRYRVNGERYESTLVGVNADHDTPSEQCSPTRRRYREGDVVTVRYDPQRPNRALLEPGMGTRDALVATISFAGIVFLVWLGVR